MSPPPPPTAAEIIVKLPSKSTSTTTTPGEGVVRRKKKLVSSGGQKWFKGTPRKSRPQNNNNATTTITLPGHHHHHHHHHHMSSVIGGSLAHNNILHHHGMESPPPLPPLLVQFSLDGHPDFRLSVHDQLHLTSKKEKDEVTSTPSSPSKGRHKKRAKLTKLDTEETEKPEGAKVEVTVKPLPQPLFHEIYEYELPEATPLPNAYIRWMERPGEELGEEIEYDVDEEDSAWLDLINRSRDGGSEVSLEVMELLMDRLEKESYLQMQVTGMDQRPVIDDDAVCCICMDGECQNSNAILFCDMCNLAVHQECYGVPYIPEGQWLCRRCLQSPSRAVDCVLCPNKGGAFKQTDDGGWAHVVCAIWIPEVCFANTVFLEPVDSVTNIPPARWRLCCFICKYKGRGACIQCHKSNCYTAFHVTCAQHAGLCMKMETVRVGSTVTVRKTAYCDNHAPPDFIRSRDGDSPTVRQKLKACRKMLAEKRSAIPMVSIPTIPPERLSQISSSVSFSRKNQFIKRLLSYWKLKRIQRNGVPLLRRLQAASNHPPTAPQQPNPLSSSQHVDRCQGEYNYLMKLRQDLERARLLCELIRKREKQKREFVVLREEEWELTYRPFTSFLHNILNELAAKDPQEIFADPVDPEQVPDYAEIIPFPMDLSTMRNKTNAFEYESLEGLELDFKLMVDNCLLYNSKDTMFYRAGVKMQEMGGIIFREAERVAKQIGFQEMTGLHERRSQRNTKNRTEAATQSDEAIVEEIDTFLQSDKRHSLSSSAHIAAIEALVDKAIRLKHPVTKRRRYSKLKAEIQRVKRLSRTALSTTSSSTLHLHSGDDEQSPVSSPTIPQTGHHLNPHHHPNINQMSTPLRGAGTNSPKKRTVLSLVDSPTSTKSSSSTTTTFHRSGGGVSSSSSGAPGRRLRNKSVLEVEEVEREEKESVRIRPPKRKVVQQLESEAVRRRGSIYKISSSVNNCTSGSSSGVNLHNESATLPSPPTSQPQRLRRVKNSSDSRTSSCPQVFPPPPPPTTPSSNSKTGSSSATLSPLTLRKRRKQQVPPEEVVEETGQQRLTRMGVSNGLLSSTHLLRNGPKSSSLSSLTTVSPVTTISTSSHTLRRKGGGGGGGGSGRVLADSFSVYRETEMNSDGESDGEEPEDEEGLITEEEEEEEEPSSSSSDDDDDDDDDSDSSSASSESPPMSLRGHSGRNNFASTGVSGRGGGLTKVVVRCSSSSSSSSSDEEEEDDENSSENEDVKEVGRGGGTTESESEEEEEGRVHWVKEPMNLEQIPLEPLSVVWAKCRDGVWSAALIIDPEMGPNFHKNGVAIPAPPLDILSKRPGGRRRRDKNIFLVLFFDKYRTWEWVSRAEVQPLGVDPVLDNGYLKVRSQDKRIRRAYEKAILHCKTITGGAGLQPLSQLAPDSD